MANQFYDIKSLAISHSSRSMGRSCWRKFEMRKFYLHEGRDKTFAADVGTCLHTGYQTWLKTHDQDEAVIDMMLDYPVEDFFDDTKNRDRTIEACYATLMNMIAVDQMKNYELATIKALDGKEYPAIEVPFEIELVDFKLDNDVPVSYTGWIDAILYDRSRDMYMVVDVKTHRQNYDDLTAKYEYDEQCLPYGLVLENILGRPVGEFEVYYFSCYIDLLKPKAQFYPFIKTRDMIFDWAQGLYYDLRQLRQFYETGWFPRATSGDTCFAYGRPCQFFNECVYRDHEVLKQIVTEKNSKVAPAENRRGEWNPWIKIPLKFGE